MTRRLALLLWCSVLAVAGRAVASDLVAPSSTAQPGSAQAAPADAAATPLAAVPDAVASSDATAPVERVPGAAASPSGDLGDLVPLVVDVLGTASGVAAGAATHRRGHRRRQRATPLVAAGLGATVAAAGALLVAPPTGVALGMWVAAHALLGGLGAVGVRPIVLKGMMGRVTP